MSDRPVSCCLCRHRISGPIGGIYAHDSPPWDSELLTEEEGERISIAILFRTESQPAYEEQVPALAAGPLVKQCLRTKVLEEYELLKREYL